MGLPRRDGVRRGHANVCGCNDRNELTSSERCNTLAPNDPNNPSDPNHAFDRAYAYDPIGNREWYKKGSDPNAVSAVSPLKSTRMAISVATGGFPDLERRLWPSHG